jgi:hypothetical protein
MGDRGTMNDLKLVIGMILAAACLSACSPPGTQTEVPQTTTPPIDLSALDGSPGCNAEYELTGPSEVLLEKSGTVIERGMEVMRTTFQQHFADVGSGADPAYGSIGFSRTSDEPTLLNVMYLMPCSEIQEPSSRLLAAIHDDRAMSDLLDGARFVLASQTEQPLKIVAPTPTTESQQ